MVVALVLFGSRKIPEFAKGLGQAIKEFKKASSDVSNEIHNCHESGNSASASARARQAASRPRSCRSR